MAQVTHGVNSNSNKFSLSYYSLTSQIIIINFLTTFLSLLFLLFFNYMLVSQNNNIENIKENINLQIDSITKFLENNAIIRIPLFDEENCKRSISPQEEINESNCTKVVLSDPQLDPTSSQNHLFVKYLNQTNNIKIYNDNLIKFADTEDLYYSSDVVEIDIYKKDENPEFKLNYKSNYLNTFNLIQKYFDIKKLQKSLNIYRGDINIVIETIKSKNFISKIYLSDNNYFLTKSKPIIYNNKIYGVVIVSGNLITENYEAALISFNLFNLFLIIIFSMFFLSFFFSRSIVYPIKLLSQIVKFEKDKSDRKNHHFRYPKRNDEIGILSNEIKTMSKDLKIRINELENFAADVSHELKNPLASLKNSNELLIQNKIKEDKKDLLLKNIATDVDRMNVLISDISNYTRTQLEIEKEYYNDFDLNIFVKELIQSYNENKKNININYICDIPSIKISSNKNKLAQVFINLIDNSISFSPHKSDLLIKITLEKDKHVTILFADQGTGIKSSDKDKVFERFYSDRSNNSEFHSGLGLSISKKIVESFSGTLELIDSFSESYKGACFKLKIPLKD